MTGGILYLSNSSSSDGPAIIKSADSCSLLKTQRAVSALNGVLPERSEYSFDEDLGVSQSTEVSDSFSSSCFVRGGESTFLSARAQMMISEASGTWESAVFGDELDGTRKATPFAAGVHGIASPSKAAAFIPCVPKGQIPGGEYNLSVVVDLKKRGDSSDSQARKSLIDLTLSAADHAHRAAKCTLPSMI
ncbi:hypothetical protein [Streptomyces sp. A1499]|uniref:hypothetical protein n=1 Tax=Streptomyces sp. A1499 TaxID=2563104 RepID=UPI00109EE045|nr:hypothetical protein [Streptomyces sp. A1499]THC41808.1 hypothetical protein E7X58_36515 [Streptomyces sp. A1499]